MRVFRQIRLRLRSLFRGDRVDEDLDAELRDHLDRQAAAHRAAGLSPAEARVAALREFGNLTQIQELCRDARRVNLLEDLLRDMRHGLLSMRRAPGFTATIVLTLAVGIGATTAIFSVVNAVVLRPLPYREPGRLAMLWTDDPHHDIHEEGVSYPNFDDWRRTSRSFEDMAIVSRNVSATITGGQDPEQARPAVVSHNLFAVLGVEPILGRVLSAEDVERRERVVVLSHSLWLRRFGAAADAVGKTLEVDGVAWLVIGVMPASFQFPSADTDFWQPLTAHRAWPGIERDRYGDWGRVVGRLKPNITLAQAQAEMTAIGGSLAIAHPPAPVEQADFAGFGVNVVPLTVQVTGRELPFALWVLFGAVVCVLLIACANVASLLMARGAVREREISVRRALGARRGRIIRQLLTESLLLACAAGALGLALAAAGVRTLKALGPGALPRLQDVRIDAGVLGFALATSVVAVVLFGIAPALRLSRVSGGLGCRASPSGRRSTRIRRVLVVVEFALSATLLSGTGLLIRSFLHVQAAEPGFRPERVLTMRLAVPGSREAALRIYPQVLERIRALPGVTQVGMVEDVLQRRNPDYAIVAEGRPREPNAPLSGDAVSADFFQAIGCRLVKGRVFSDQDRSDSPPVAIVNEAMARRFWPGEDPIGKRLRAADAERNDPWTTVVGLVADMRRQGLERQPIAQVFWPHAQRPVSNMDVVVRTSADPTGLARATREQIRAIDRRVPVFQMATLEKLLDESVSTRRFQSFLLALLSTIALVLAATGIYGLMHYAVVQRTHELGVRMALGARGIDVLRTIIGEGASLAVAGVVVGMMMSVWVTQAFASLLVGVTAHDPLTMAFVPSIIAAAAVVVCCLPARRAMRIDPLIALRDE